MGGRAKTSQGEERSRSGRMGRVEEVAVEAIADGLKRKVGRRRRERTKVSSSLVEEESRKGEAHIEIVEEIVVDGKMTVEGGV